MWQIVAQLSSYAAAMVVTVPADRPGTTLGVSISCRMSEGAAIQRERKAAARNNRIQRILQRSASVRTLAERKELASLLAFDTYNECEFTTEHANFKAAHNKMFVDLALYCGIADARCFYLDGPSGRTSEALLDAGFDRAQLYTANWHATTCDALRSSPRQLANVAEAFAEDALHGCFGSVPFTALYLDGCGGATAPIIGCIDGLFSGQRSLPPTIAVGFTLTKAEPSGRSMANREVDIHRALASSCRQAGYIMSHVADEPHVYGTDSDTLKSSGGTLTSWLVLSCKHVQRK
jgi:hypothetical protein